MSDQKTAAVIARDRRYETLVKTKLRDKGYEVQDNIENYSDAGGLDLVVTDFNEHLFDPRTDQFSTSTIIYSTQDADKIEKWGLEIEEGGYVFEQINEEPPAYFGVKGRATYDDFEEVIDRLERENSADKSISEAEL